jgi:glucose-1-phosphate thymidylyltransferase
VLDQAGRPVSLEEKPKDGRTGLAVPGLYFYDRHVCEIAATLRPSQRNELEITDINKAYLERGALHVEPIGRGIAWLDGGTPDDLFEAGQLVRVLEQRTGMRIACPEEIAVRKGFIDVDGLLRSIADYPEGSYKRYLQDVVAGIDA